MDLYNLCSKLRTCGKFDEYWISTFLHNFECTVDYYITTKDLKGLDIFSLAYISSIYEYAVNRGWVACDLDVYKLCNKVYCPKEENCYYSLYGSIEVTETARVLADKLYNEELKESIYEFRKHGIIADCFNYSV